MTPSKEQQKKTEGDEAGMSDVGVGGLFKGPPEGGAPSGALAGWAQAAPAAPVAVAPVAVPAAQPAVPAQPFPVVQQFAPAAELSPELTDAETAKPVGFYTSATVASRHRKYRTQQGFTNTQVVLLAAEAAAERGIAETVAAARRTPRIQSKLFPVAPDDSDLRGLGPVQLQYKPTRDQLRIINQLVAESGLPDHTKFIAIALDQFLPGKRDN
ncbi:hypothetical protein ACFRKE_01065 [Kitasatospora indigofera]|uniref:hypothetical protein n=1 Tax=Kitasatospora indigofera TaxID=67307 RepID=UPI0036BE2668